MLSGVALNGLERHEEAMREARQGLELNGDAPQRAGGVLLCAGGAMRQQGQKSATKGDLMPDDDAVRSHRHQAHILTETRSLPE